MIQACFDCGTMPDVAGLAIVDYRVLVLADGDTQGAQNNARGHLFEAFVARLLYAYGYKDPTTRNLNVVSDGIELDVVTESRLNGAPATAECKSYSRPVHADALTSFYGKLHLARIKDPRTLGIMVALPRLTANGEEVARAIREHDRDFLYLPSDEIVARLHKEGLIDKSPTDLGETSDPAVVISKDGTYSASLVLDPDSRRPVAVAVWSVRGNVPQPVRSLLAADEYAQGLPVRDAREVGAQNKTHRAEDVEEDFLLATVRGSRDDFEYQLPASPKYFVGRRATLSRLKDLFSPEGTVVVLNAQSGWGKSSLALKFGELAITRGGHALVVDTRTAASSRYVVEALRRAVDEAVEVGLLELSDEASWATLTSALRTLASASWKSSDRPLLVFFDQFENVFRSVDLT